MPGRRIALSRRDFAATSADRSSKRAVSPHFSITCSSLGVGVAVIVSKKVARGAVTRHLIKRRIREVLHATPLPPCALMVYARAGTADLSYAQLQTELTPLLQKLLPEFAS
jgi:ribonuclease P protein component